MIRYAQLLKRLGIAALTALLGFVTGVVVLYVLWVRGGPPLQLWHTVELREEFGAEQADAVRSFRDYKALEERLFAELDAKVYAKGPTGPEYALRRFSSGSASDPRRRETNWNRSFELLPEDQEAIGGVLLLHGMSDSPYSLRAIGLALAGRGYRVLGLRMPGHGTAPAGLLRVTWEDMAAATQLGMRHLAERLGGRPLHMIGYSTGAALALDYALDAFAANDGQPTVATEVALQTPASLVLVSPAVGVTKAAALTPWLIRLSMIPGLDQVAWTTLLPEFDPFNYNAFSANASLQVHRMTRSTTARLQQLTRSSPLKGFPATLVLLSVVDATVSPDAAIDHLLARLAPDGHELLLYDINRVGIASPFLVADTAPLTDRLLTDGTLPFALTLITNSSPDTRDAVALRKRAFSPAVARTDRLDTRWPRDTLSLSHVDLPFPPDDPLYGLYPPANENALFLGQLAVRSERGVLQIPAQWLLRLRHNPFYDYQEQRILEWVDRANGGGG